ncbi:snRNA-activating protein of 50kDa MW C terminal-domain-containing protein [Pterulicium gracile]|uniref:snRNA-activating protein of 50kDa MW C terminal-domain-containing protein n=1 Tax=Pterulicium gracile TaxID=1884261 RepID=A0A5C3QK02_9AGAR|nr:snRNA-activating protein of 50kDa MW C terminal-domain-containing protein [Pterula gracilis]
MQAETQEAIDYAFSRRGVAKTTPMDPDIEKVKKKRGITLSSWDLPHESAYFIRALRTGETNGLLLPKPSPFPTTSPTLPSPSPLITLSIYTRPINPPGPCYRAKRHPTRTSSHIFLSDNTLDDLDKTIGTICVGRKVPVEVEDEDGVVVGYRPRKEEGEEWGGCVMVIEGNAYARKKHGGTGTDYAENLTTHLSSTLSLTNSTTPAPFRTKAPQGSSIATTLSPTVSLTRSPLSLDEVKFRDLEGLRVGEPYFVMHDGHCEHYWVVESIRLPHPLDPPPTTSPPSSLHPHGSSQYPLTIHLSPLSLPSCRACTRAPARFAIVGDVRLGESPCVLCAPCWGELREGREEGVVVEVPVLAGGG